MIKGNTIRLNTLHLYSASMNGVREVQGSSASGGGGIVPNPYIQFADAKVERVLMTNGVSSDGIGITKEDAAKVSTIERWFKGTAIGSFDEFKFFKGVSSVLGGYQNGAFYNCTNLKTISIPEDCKELQYYAFQNCTALGSVTGLEYVETMGLAVFDSCTSLVINELRMPNLKGTLRANVFTACTMTRAEDLGQITHIAETGYNKGIFPKMLEFLRLPDTLVDISNYAFQINTNLQIVICEAVNPPTAAVGIFNGSNCPIYVPDASLEAYKTATNWSAYADRIRPISEIEGVVIEHGVSLTNYGTLKTNANYSVVGFVKTNGATSIKWGVTGGTLGLLCEYTENGTCQDYWGAQTNPRTVTIQSSSTQVKAAFSTANLDNAYIYDNTNGIYLWKGKNVE